MSGAAAGLPRPPGDGRGALRTRPLALVAALAVALCAAWILVAASAAAADTTTYSAEQTIPVPPASDYASPGGGDGWAVALSNTQVFNVFHHDSALIVACHQQSDGSACWPASRRITDGSGNDFASQGQPGLYLDQATGKLYVYATRSVDSTAGVVCIDTTIAATTDDPFCGFTALTPPGDGPLDPAGISGVGDPSLIGTHWYAFNYVDSAGVSGAQNTLLCFDVSTDAACAGQPFTVPVGSGTVSDNPGFPSPAGAAIGSKVFIPLSIGGSNELACFDDATQGGCAGAWPLTLTFSYVGENGAPFPMLDATGAIIGVCLPATNDPCYGLDGATATTPANLPSVVFPSDAWNGPAFVLGPRVYVPNGVHPAIPGFSGDSSDVVQCFDYSTGDQCANFPKTFTNLGFLYTVNPDPQRPTCIWVNADDGTSQIQSFDAYSGGPCGQGAIRVLASQFVVHKAVCFPTAYQSLQIVSPDRSTYSDGSIAFQDGDGNPIPGAADLPLDGTGTVSLQGLNLNTQTGLPQFVITLNGQSGTPGQVVVKLVWTATYDPSCVGPGISATPPPPPPGPSAGKGTPPASIAPPSIRGRAVPGERLTCLPGAWSGSPTSFTYTWNRNGTVINGATGDTYLVRIWDEGTRITCTVTAHNGAGGSSARSRSLRTVLCPAPSGRVAGTDLGVFRLGQTRHSARRRLNRFRVTHNHFDNFCLYHGWGIRLGYASPQLMRLLTGAERRSANGKVVLMLTANRFYALDGVRPGTRVASVRRRLHLGTPFHVGRNFWYFVHGSHALGVLKVRRGVIQEVGLASRALTRGHDAQRVFIRSFNDV